VRNVGICDQFARDTACSVYNSGADWSAGGSVVRWMAAQRRGSVGEVDYFEAVTKWVDGMAWAAEEGLLLGWVLLDESGRGFVSYQVQGLYSRSLIHPRLAVRSFCSRPCCCKSRDTSRM
jgi:hypothetical protein